MIKKTEDKINPLKNVDLLYDYQSVVLDQMWPNNLSNEVNITSAAAALQVNQTSIKSTDLISQMNSIYQMYPKTYLNSNPWEDEKPYIKPVTTMYRSDNQLNIYNDEGKVESISREELIKYIEERKVIRENEVVRKVYERYQVAVKLVRSDDDGDAGV